MTQLSLPFAVTKSLQHSEIEENNLQGKNNDAKNRSDLHHSELELPIHTNGGREFQ